MSSVFSRFQKQNDDSDQSISEEENLNDDCSGNWTHMGDCVAKKGDMQLPCQLDLLKEQQKFVSASRAISSPLLMQTNLSNEDEIEFPAFDRSDNLDQLPDEASKCFFDDRINLFRNAVHGNITDEETISDDDRVVFPDSLSIVDGGEVVLNGARRKGAGIIYSSDKPACSSSYSKVDEHYKDYRGGLVKHKTSLLSSLKCTTEDSPLNFMGNNYSNKLFNAQSANESNSATHKEITKSTDVSLKVYDEKMKQSQGHELPNDGIVYQHSMAEILDGFQEKSGFPLSNSNKHSRTKDRHRSIVHKKSKTSSCAREMDHNNEPDSSDIGQSSGNEDGPKNLKSCEPGKTMADHLQEIFGVISTSDLPAKTLSRQSGGIHEKLQCILQNEKENEMNFLRTLPLNASSVGENQYMDVKIISRSLEAKLTVCRCALAGKRESLKAAYDYDHENSGRALTILFSSKICTDVELEMGNLIRIYAPWKEVYPKGHDEVILLATYFSLICP